MDPFRVKFDPGVFKVWTRKKTPWRRLSKIHVYMGFIFQGINSENNPIDSIHHVQPSGK